MTLQIMSIKFLEGKICLTESATTHIILQSHKYFMSSTLLRANVIDVLGPMDPIESSGRAMILLSNNTKLCIRSNGSDRKLWKSHDIVIKQYPIMYQ